ncbi:hypothetical protein [Janthinobacterium sp. OK676]|uniref:hypothetical protein n=1 Tax=Janthinobacterium sp. OK676 TaxID=1855295 RepID=UPI001114675E|nr:hypothetical protein [Janthinobacterium sp. OK676]
MNVFGHQRPDSIRLSTSPIHRRIQKRQDIHRRGQNEPTRLPARLKAKIDSIINKETVCATAPKRAIDSLNRAPLEMVPTKLHVPANAGTTVEFFKNPFRQA